MDNMFYNANDFNGDISSWDVTSVTFMNQMFKGANDFNNDISGWNPQSVISMSEMFNTALSFDQDLSGWDITSVSSMFDMFDGVTLSTPNYDALLIGWEGQSVNNGVTFDGGNSQYTAGGAAATARQALIDDHSWSITDGGSV
jgi:surface protein